MAQVQVTATARLRCRDASGKFYREDLRVTITTDEELDNDLYTPALYAEAASSIPDNCVGVKWEIDNVIPVEGGGGEDVVEQVVTVYILVWCVDENGNMLGHEYTLTFDVLNTSDIQDVIQIAESSAEQWWGTTSEDRYADCAGAVGYDWTIIAPTYYQYYPGG